MNILVVDDVAFNRNFLKKILTQSGHEVQLAENGWSALKLIHENDFGLILTDLVMPDMDGIKLYEESQNLPKYKNMGILFMPPFVLITASDDCKRLEKARNIAGFIEILEKPVDRNTFLETIKRIESGDYLLKEEETALNILVIDPFETTYELTCTLVKDGNHQVKRAKTAEEAQELFSLDSQISLVICEFELPNENGLELFETFKTIERFNDNGSVPMPNFILVAEAIGEKQVKAIQDSGLKDILIKPFPSERLEEKIANVYKELSQSIGSEEDLAPKVLVVDDIGFNRVLIEKMVKKMGFVVQSVESCFQALEAIKNDSTISVVITDLMMPEMNGIELFENVTSSSGSKSPVPSFILTTASNDLEQLEEAENSGVSQVFKKPINAEKLRKSLSMLMSPEEGD